MRPSFFALFKRGKYLHSTPLPSNPRRKLLRTRGDMQERERFAAAAIAFGWQYNQAVRKHVWRTICRFHGDPEFGREATILVEPEEWADLLIINPSGRIRFVYAIECKIGAELKKHQDPTQRAFATTSRGYGRLLIDSDRRKGARFRFVVLGLSRRLKKRRPWTQPIAVAQKFWTDFAKRFPRTPFARDSGINSAARELK